MHVLQPKVIPKTHRELYHPPRTDDTSRQMENSFVPLSVRPQSQVGPSHLNPVGVVSRNAWHIRWWWKASGNLKALYHLYTSSRFSLEFQSIFRSSLTEFLEFCIVSSVPFKYYNTHYLLIWHMFYYVLCLIYVYVYNNYVMFLIQYFWRHFRE